MDYKLQYAQKYNKEGWFVGTEIDANIARAKYYLKMIEERKSQPTKEDFIVAYNFGKLLVEQRMNTLTFKLYGFHFTSNKNRKTPYGFNTKTWMIQDLSTIDKLKLILTGKMHRIK